MNHLFATTDSRTNQKRNLPRDSTLTTRSTRSESFTLSDPDGIHRFDDTDALRAMPPSMRRAAPKTGAIAAPRLASRPAFVLKALVLAVAAALFVPVAGFAQSPVTANPASPVGTAAHSPSSDPSSASPAIPPATSTQAQAASDDDSAPIAVDSGLMQTSDPQAVLPNHELTSQIVFQVLAAEIALQRGQAAPAYQTYLSLARSTQDPRMAQRAAEIAVSAQSPSDALTAARLWHQYAPASTKALQFDATLLVLNGYLDEARPLLARQLAAVPDASRGEAILSLQTLIGRGPDRIGGVQTLRQLLKDDMQRPEAQTAIGRQQIVANDAPDARVSFVAALKLKPDYAPAALQLAQMGNDERHDAINIVSAYSDQHPKEHDARFLLAQLYLADNQIDPARKEFEILHKADANDPAPLFALGLLSLQAKQNKAAEKYFESYAEQAQKQDNATAGRPDQTRIDGGPAYIYLAQIAVERKDLTAADAWLSKVSPSSSQYATAQSARADLLASQKRYDEATAVLATVQPRNAHEAIMLGRADARIQMEAGHTVLAEQRLATLASLAPDDPSVVYDYALAADRNGHYKTMEAQLRHLIALEPDSAEAYNALGYSLADRNERLDEADKLIQKALSLAPGDPSITDSAGWVKFRLGDDDQALTLLRRAYQLMPNAETGAHIADVLWSQGKQDEARKALRAAQQLDPTDDTLLKTMTRLKVDQQ